MSFSEFNTAVLGDLVTIKGGKRLPKGASLISEKNSHPYIKVKDMNGGKKVRLSKTFEYVDDVTQKSIKNYIVNKNDIIISIVGTIGLVSVIDDSLDNANLTENCVKLINLTNVDKDYLYYFLTSDAGQNEMRKGTVGSTQPKLPIYNIKKIELPLPQLDIQKAIAHILSTLDDKIEVNNQINKTLENMAQAIFKQWFVDFEFPNEDGEPYKSSGGEMIESELGMIPDGWKIDSVLNNIEEVSQKNKKCDDIPVLSVVKEGKFVLSDDYFTKRVYSKSTKNYKVIYKNNLGYNPSRANIGSISVLREYEKGLLSPIYKIFQLSGSISPEYFFCYMKQKMFKDMIIKHSSGTTRQNFDYKGFSEFIIAVPPKQLQDSFADLFKGFEKLINQRNIESLKLKVLRDALLPKLISGEIRVPINNN